MRSRMDWEVEESLFKIKLNVVKIRLSLFFVDNLVKRRKVEVRSFKRSSKVFVIEDGSEL